MALAKGTNCGFVTTAPTADPGGLDNIFDYYARAFKDVAPVGAVKVTEIGWYCDNATEEADFEVGLYAADGAGGIPGTLLYPAASVAKGTTAGWKKKTGLDWAITAGTTYYIAVQLDDTATDTNCNYASLAGEACYRDASQPFLPSPWDSTLTGAILYAFYAVYETSADLSASPSDGIGISETISAVVTPLITAPADSIAISETVLAELSILETAPAENIAISETVSAFVTPLIAAPADGLAISETIAAFVSPLITSPAESIAISEEVLAELVTLEAVVADTVAISEELLATLEIAAPLATVTDGIGIGEEVIAELATLESTITDAIGISESVITQLSILEAVVTDNLDICEEPIITTFSAGDQLQDIEDKVDALQAAIDALQLDIDIINGKIDLLLAKGTGELSVYDERTTQPPALVIIG